jgi:hypothetical protein
MDGVDVPNLGGLGIGAALLVLAVRVLFRQGDGWQDVLRSAREDAAAARSDAAAARDAESECRRRLAHLEQRLGELEAVIVRSTEARTRKDDPDHASPA